MKVVFCASEVYPFAKTGGLADVCGSLPLALEKNGVDVEIFMPLYRCVDRNKHQVKQINDGLWRSTIGKNITVHFIANSFLYDRAGLYGEGHGDYGDNLDRFQFLCSQTLQMLRQAPQPPDIIHCHDWHTALIPAYVRERFREDTFFQNTKTVLTIHNLAFQGAYPAGDFNKIGLPRHLFNNQIFEFYGKLNLLKAGIHYADRVTTVSEQYAREIQTREFGYNMDGVLRHYQQKLEGIINGLDYDIWNPETDSLISRTFDPATFGEGKAANKKFLQERCGLPVQPGTPLVGFVSRLAHQKGVDLILDAMGDLLWDDIQWVFQGVGDIGFQNRLNGLGWHNRHKMSSQVNFDESLAHAIYAGADFLIMPSRYEPCGLSQMIAFRYGTVPVVFRTGGLADTVIPYDDPQGRGNGFMFTHYHRQALVDCVRTAAYVFKDKPRFEHIGRNALAVRLTWEQSAARYQKIYDTLCTSSQSPVI
ncbi:MAG: glycogen synthase GlgA [Candidatus Omnitrophica bacterium]|nr:glycogen synthase GlgA [Candidatus Omnitrophota bacterium]